MKKYLLFDLDGTLTNTKKEITPRTRAALRRAAETLGDFSGIDPFMTLAFVSLPVIPEIRLTSRGIVSLC